MDERPYLEVTAPGIAVVTGSFLSGETPELVDSVNMGFANIWQAAW